MVGFGGIPVDLDRPAEQRHRVGKPTLLQPDQAQSVSRSEVTLIRLEHGCVKPLRFGQLSLRMASDRFLERFEHRTTFLLCNRGYSLAHGAILRTFSTRIVELVLLIFQRGRQDPLNPSSPRWSRPAPPGRVGANLRYPANDRRSWGRSACERALRSRCAHRA